MDRQGAQAQMIGRRFGRLVIVDAAPTQGRGHSAWECVCDCGMRRVARTHHLRDGLVKSCGCLKRERPNGRTHGRSASPEYQIWKGMKKRCLNPAATAFKNYGGRGIGMAREWIDSFEAFLSEVGARPSPAHSIERKDNSKGYEPGNCRWATRAEQSRNTRRTHLVSYDGVELPMKDWAAKAGINYTTVANRLNRDGWTVEDALRTVVEKRK